MSQNQQTHHGEHKAATDLKPAVRNNYFYGKLLDGFHLELEQDYFNTKRRLLNRLVVGPGVVCGLGVELVNMPGGGTGVRVMPGLAIDRCGREIIVATPSQPQPLPELPEYETRTKQYKGAPARRLRDREGYEPHYYCEVPFAHVVLCYHECETDPSPAMAGDCEAVALCASGSIREQYRIEIKPGFARRRDSNFPRNPIKNGELNMEAIVDYVTDKCRAFPEDCCIPLANVELQDSGSGWDPEVDIGIRPIVYTNRLLFHLISSLVQMEEGEEDSESESEAEV